MVSRNVKVYYSACSPFFLFFFFFFFFVGYHWPRLDDTLVSENPRKFSASHFWGPILGCAYTICSYGQILTCELNYHDQKIRRTLKQYIRKHWTAVSTLLGIINSVYHNLHHWRSNQRSQIAVPKLYNWVTSSYRTQVTPNQQVTVIAQPNNVSVSCKLKPYSFQRTRSHTRATSSQETKKYAPA